MASRYFTHVTGFTDETLAIEIRADGTSALHLKGGEMREAGGAFSVDSALRAVDCGDWIETPGIERTPEQIEATMALAIDRYGISPTSALAAIRRIVTKRAA